MYVLFKHMYILDRCWLQTTYLQVHQSSGFFFKEYTHVFYIDYFYKFVLDKKKIPDVSGISSIFIICDLE